MSDGVIVQIGLDDLYSLKSSADVSPIYKAERDALQKKLDAANQEKEALQKEAETVKANFVKLTDEASTQAQEINQLRQRVVDGGKRQKLWHVTETAINDAKGVLDRHFRPIASEETLHNETVRADNFYAVYNALRDLVKLLEQEGMA